MKEKKNSKHLSKNPSTIARPNLSLSSGQFRSARKREKKKDHAANESSFLIIASTRARVRRWTFEVRVGAAARGCVPGWLGIVSSDAVIFVHYGVEREKNPSLLLFIHSSTECIHVPTRRFLVPHRACEKKKPRQRRSPITRLRLIDLLSLSRRGFFLPCAVGTGFVSNCQFIISGFQVALFGERGEKLCG